MKKKKLIKAKKKKKVFLKEDDFLHLSFEDQLIGSEFQKFNKFFFSNDFLFLILEKNSKMVKVYEFTKKINYYLFVGFKIIYLYVSPFLFQKMNLIFFIGLHNVLICKFSLNKNKRVFKRVIFLENFQYIWDKIIFIDSNQFFVKDSGGYIHLYNLSN